jgi:hypothetical protein
MGRRAQTDGQEKNRTKNGKTGEPVEGQASTGGKRQRKVSGSKRRGDSWALGDATEQEMVGGNDVKTVVAGAGGVVARDGDGVPMQGLGFAGENTVPDQPRRQANASINFQIFTTR